MAIPMDMLTYLRDALAEVPGVASCRVGLEPDITSDDYPLIRIVPIKLARPFAVRVSELVREIECWVYFGIAQHAFEGDDRLQSLYEEIFALEAAIIAALPTTGAYLARYVETVTDQDEIDAYKLMAMRITVMGLVG